MFADDLLDQKQDKLIPTTLVRGKLEGWARVRVAGQTEWKQLWLVITAANSSTPTNSSPNVNVAQNTAPKKNRMSLLFSRESNDATLAGPSKASISLFSSSKQKDRKAAVLTMHNVTQAFAVYPERPELITRSTLIKVEGSLGNEEAAGAMASREGWLLIMPVLENTEHQSVEMLKWLTGTFPD
jgi:CCR4-NOT transcriptional complex subunit CAF120